jgi:hypothetical protein
MGHVRIGRPPKRYGWQKVVAGLSGTTPVRSSISLVGLLAAR